MNPIYYKAISYCFPSITAFKHRPGAAFISWMKQQKETRRLEWNSNGSSTLKTVIVNFSVELSAQQQITTLNYLSHDFVSVFYNTQNDRGSGSPSVRWFPRHHIEIKSIGRRTGQYAACLQKTSSTCRFSSCLAWLFCGWLEICCWSVYSHELLYMGVLWDMHVVWGQINTFDLLSHTNQRAHLSPRQPVKCVNLTSGLWTQT